MSVGMVGRLLLAIRQPSIRKNLLLLTGSVSFSLLVMELAARSVLPAPLPWLYPQLRYRPDPNLIFALAPRQIAYSADKRVEINEQGLRGAVVPYSRRVGRLRILFLGDSIVFGYGVREEEAVGSKVASLLKERGVAAEVINAGVPAYNSEQEVAYLETEGVSYNPDWVILGFCWNDINNQVGVRVSRDGWLTDEGVRPSTLARIGESEIGYRLRNWLKSSRMLYAFSIGFGSLDRILHTDDHELFRAELLEGRDTQRVALGWRRVAEVLHRLEALETTRGFRVLVVAFPVPQALSNSFPMSSYPGKLWQIAEEEDLSFMDLEPVFRKFYRGHESLFIPYDGDHPNARGHLLAAQEISEFLTAHSCPRPYKSGEPKL